MRDRSLSALLLILLVPSCRLITRAPAGGISASGTLAGAGGRGLWWEEW